jgi:cysteinyl-tRNA synthetase
MFIFNTASRKKEELKTIKPGEVSIYACGPTVYSDQHIGNMYSYVSWDILTRSLRFLDYKVKYVMNVTDVGHLVNDSDDGEDKMEKGSKKEGLSVWEIAKKYEKQFFEDEAKLNIIRPDLVCRATDYIKEQIDLVEKIEANGFTYKTSDGIYFDTSKFKDYASFARLNLEQLREGARVEVNKEKRNPTDFALWKFSPSASSGQIRQMEWDSPWGRGFPGWHSECTAMSAKELGVPFDIHTGGIDHIPIHHTNEIAQAYGAFGRSTANYWMHNGFLTFKGDKISKSLGGLYTVSELEKLGFEPLAYRYMVISSHYRSGLDFSLDNLKSAQISLNKLRELVMESLGEVDKKIIEDFKSLLKNDLAMPEVMALVWKVAKISPQTVLEMDKVLGLDLNKKKNEDEIPADILDLAKKRQLARDKKDWKEADLLREQIEKRGYLVEDLQNDCKIRKVMLI